MSRRSVREIARGREHEILRALGIDPGNGRRHQHCPLPDHQDRNPSWRWDSGKARFFCSCSSGDVAELAARMRGTDKRAASAWILEILGELAPGTETAADRAKRQRRTAQARAKAQRDADRRERQAQLDDTKAIERAQAIARRAIKADGTLGQRYLASRHITETDGVGFQRAPNSALVVPASASSGTVVAVQTIALDRSGRKAAVAVPKRTHGRPSRGYARFGPTSSTVILGEGPETTLSAREAWPGARHLACLGGLRIDPHDPDIANAEKLVLLVERCPSGNPDKHARRIAQEAATKLPGLRIFAATMPKWAAPDEPKADLNDVLQQHGVLAVADILDGAQQIAGPAPVAYPDPGRPLAKIEGELPPELTRVIAQARKWHDEPGEHEPEAVAITSTPGVGKTGATLMAVAELARDVPVVVATPDHSLAAELADRAERLGIAARTARGRTQTDRDGAPMCFRQEAAEAIAQAGYDTKSTLCERRDDFGRVKRCPHHPAVASTNNVEPCRYLRQFLRKDEIGLIVATHSHLVEPRNRVPLPGRPALVVVDESPAGQLIQAGGAGFELAAWRQPFSLTWRDKDGKWQRRPEASARLNFALGAFLEVIAKPGATTADMVEAGLDAELLDQCRADIERHLGEGKPLPGVQPNDDVNPALVRQLVSNAGKVKAARDALERAALAFRLLAEIMRAGVRELRPFELIGDDRDRLRFRSRRKLHVSEPLLLLDGSADERVMRQLVPVIDCAIDARASTPLATVRQVIDKSFSMRSLCPNPERASPKDLKTAHNLRRKIAHMIEIELAQGKRVGVISYKAICDPASEISLQAEHPDLAAAGVEFGHFGRLRGQNRFEQCDVLIVAGRPRPSVPELERIAAATFYDDPGEIERLPISAELPKRLTALRMADGSTQTVMAEYHPDPRVEAIRRQICAAELAQAIHRARPVRRACEVIVLANQPCDVTVTETVRWQDVKPSRLAVAYARGFQAGVIALSPSELWRLNSDLWPNVQAVKDDQRSKVGFSLRESLWEDSTLLAARYWPVDSGAKPFRCLVRNGMDQGVIEDALGVELRKLVIDPSVPEPPGGGEPLVCDDKVHQAQPKRDWQHERPPPRPDKSQEKPPERPPDEKYSPRPGTSNQRSNDAWPFGDCLNTGKPPP